MPLNTGTMNMADLQAVTNQSVAQFGLDAVADVLARDLAAHNALVAEMFRDYCEITADNLRRVGASGAGEMIIADDFSRAPTQKPATGATLGFPKDLHQTAIGWTQRFLNKATPAELAAAQLNIQGAHRRTLVRQMKRAIYDPTNDTVADYTERNAIDLPVKRFFNADGWTISNGPNGETYNGASHTHYTAEASLSAAGLLAAVNNVVEHGLGGAVQVCINAANEAAVRALTGFVAYVDARLQLGTGQVPTERLTIANSGNRPIGLFGQAEVWVKPWAVAGYAVILDTAAAEKPLALRTPNGVAPALVRVAENDAFPLIAQFYESEFGFGALNRGAGAVHQFTSGTYTEPSIS
jgi:hypothetical protein